MSFNFCFAFLKYVEVVENKRDRDKFIQCDILFKGSSFSPLEPIHYWYYFHFLINRNNVFLEQII